MLADTFKEVRTIEAAIRCDVPKLASLERESGKAARVLFKMHLTALDKALKNKDGLTPEEIDLIADEVMTRWGRLISYADVSVVFRNARVGKYGELYQQLTAAKVIKWFDDYCEERMAKCYELNRERDRMQFDAEEASDDNLTALGYRIDAVGRLSIDMDRVSANDEKRAERGKRMAEERQKKIDADNEYLRWRLEYERNKTL